MVNWTFHLGIYFGLYAQVLRLINAAAVGLRNGEREAEDK